jgi:hypothetical protein
MSQRYSLKHARAVTGIPSARPGDHARAREEFRSPILEIYATLTLMGVIEYIGN